MSALLEVRNVSLSFRGVKAISDLSFSVKLGEICALIGPNGAGKSSLLNILNGVYRADAGQLFFAAEPLRRPHPLKAARLGIGRTFQNNALFKKMSVVDNLLTGLSRFQRTFSRTGPRPAACLARGAGVRRACRAGTGIP